MDWLGSRRPGEAPVDPAPRLANGPDGRLLGAGGSLPGKRNPGPRSTLIWRACARTAAAIGPPDGQAGRSVAQTLESAAKRLVRRGSVDPGLERHAASGPWDLDDSAIWTELANAEVPDLLADADDRPPAPVDDEGGRICNELVPRRPHGMESKDPVGKWNVEPQPAGSRRVLHETCATVNDAWARRMRSGRQDLERNGALRPLRSLWP